ncbi:MAG: hypothetical protein BRC28_00105 [Nanohaloarchaea archaeon SW_4_43_9]|nr:MAG: hypothetical protein BRC28_00105 [Nanohaloarchaea archaeon SW_4_43_9]
MTVLKLFRPRNLDNPQMISNYFEIDADYLENFLEATGGDFEEINRLKLSIIEKLDRSEELSKKECLFLTAIFVGDAEWLGPNSEWYNRSLRYAIQLADGFVHHQWYGLAEEYGDVSKVSLPDFSEPESFDINGRPPTFYTSGLRQRVDLIASVTQLEWCLYVCDQIDIDNGLENPDKVMMDGIKYFIGEKESLPKNSARIHKMLFLSDKKWLKDVRELFDIRSLIMYYFERRFDAKSKELEKLNS